MRRWLTALTLTAALAALVAASTASQAPARGALPATIKVAKKKGGPYRPYLRRNIPDGGTASLWFRVKGTTDVPEQLTLHDDGSSSDLEGWSVRWFEGKKNITSEVHLRDYDLDLGQVPLSYVEARIKNRAQDAKPFCLQAAITDDVDSESVSAGVDADCLVGAPRARGDLPASVKSAKGDKSGPYTEFVKSNMPVGETREVWFRVKSTAEVNQVLHFHDDGSSEFGEGFKVRWLKHGTNVTDDVAGGGPGYEFTLKPDQPKYFSARVKRQQEGEAFCLVGEAYDNNTAFSRAALAAFGNVKCAL